MFHSRKVFAQASRRLLHTQVGQDPLPRIVGVVGTTGVGKTKLGVELARAVPTLAPHPDPGRSAPDSRLAPIAEVINSDSMQFYKGFDIMTNKTTPREMQGVKHHLFNILEPDQSYSVQDFESDALRLIQDLWQRSAVPIFVGGSDYFLRHLIFGHGSTGTPASSWGSMGQRQEQAPRQVEPKEANPSGAHRYTALIFWPYAETSVLNKNLDDRVDKMVELGLLEEVEQMWALQGRNLETADWSKGVFQSIGYKQLLPYISSRHGSSILPQLLLEAGIERTKTATRRYAQLQIDRLKNALLPTVKGLQDPAQVTVVMLDATDLTRWEENVRQPAQAYLRAFLANEPLPDPTSLSPLAERHLSGIPLHQPGRERMVDPSASVADLLAFDHAARNFKQ
ncbi:BZ3500_MvSof-1268-A1-R1_Chr3-1g05758 [Microbotryum saponariae]|uniref:BZ3500_MvSof-1268-A1-R1_Chr3-1g05758 protein n=1 Tax=Microbotryum saponariae TaxID=289078 RepID=A0A2X0LIQ6_9BASI|nr:BZ3500_MvSof-1268-A1-R1_Chr3-1g05758 [Microbotryum saponariae]SDA04948.1 BZ3501_MvSof-1269-A2-R1_Chr3-1g05428 [Microbotryum saponariae]